MANMSDFIQSGESLGDPVIANDLLEQPTVEIFPLNSPGFKDDERVLLEIPYSSEACVWLGKSAIALHTLSGVGTLTTVSLESGFVHEVGLKPRSSVRIAPGRIYWYKNEGNEPLILRDTCLGFNEADEPTLRKMVDTFTGLILPQTEAA